MFFEITKGIDFESNNLGHYYASLKPFRNWEVEPLEIQAQAAVSVEISQNGEKKFLYAKNQEEILAIASLTKLMTAYLAINNYDLNQEVIISEKAATINGKINYFRAGERFYLKDLLYPLLMESSNEVAQAIAEIKSEGEFIQLMNEQAQKWGLENTRFFNAHGLDPFEQANYFKINYSNADDLAILTWQVLKGPLIKQIFLTQDFKLYNAKGIFHHLAKNNNELLDNSEQAFWQKNILAGKTGWTLRANGCLIIALDNPKNQSQIINVILGSEDRFEEIKKLIDWIYNAYRW